MVEGLVEVGDGTGANSTSTSTSLSGVKSSRITEPNSTIRRML